MSELSDLIAADFATIQARDLPMVFVFNGTEYPALRGSIPKSDKQHDSGYTLDYDFQLFVLASVLPDPAPALGNKVTISGVIYRVVRSRPDPSGGVVVYDLASPSR